MRTLFVIAVVLSSVGGQPAHAQTSHPIRESELSRRIEAALDETVTVRYVEAPLWQIVQDIRSGFGINVILDERALEDISLDLDSPISLEMNGVALESMLEEFGREHGLCWTVRNESLVITTQQEAENDLHTHIYPVHDLVDIGESGPDFDSLINTITLAIDPESWEDLGGPGAIDGFRDSMLVCLQTSRVHRKVRRLLTAMRRASGRPSPVAAESQSLAGHAGRRRSRGQRYMFSSSSPWQLPRLHQ